MRHRVKRGASVGVLLAAFVVGPWMPAALASPAQAPLVFDDFEWELLGEGNGSASLNHVKMSFVSADFESGCGDWTTIQYQTTAPFDGVVTASFEWSTEDVSSPGGFGPYDWLSFTVGTWSPMLASGSTAEDSGATLFHVEAGETFGFAMTSADCTLGPGKGSISDFRFTPGSFAELELWADQGGAFSDRLLATLDPAPGLSVFGRDVALLGDVDGDGVGDLATSAQSGEVWVHSGATGALLWTLAGAQADHGFALAALPDVDGDGADELVVATPSSSTVELRSGADGALLWHWSVDSVTLAGEDVAAVGDQDGDGVADVLVGVRTVTSAQAEVRVLSGADGTLLRTLGVEPEVFGFGEVVADAGDVDGDGVRDLFVGAPGTFARAFVFGQGSDAPILELNSDALGIDLTLASAGDLDGDGRAELLMGAPYAAVVLEGSPPSGLPTAVGVISVFDGADGALLNTIHGEAEQERLGGTLVGDYDFYGDGRRLIVSTRASDDPLSTTIVALDPLGGQQVGQQVTEVNSAAFAIAAATRPTRQIALGFPYAYPGGKVAAWHRFAAPEVPLLEGSGIPAPGGAWAMEVSRGLSQAPGYLVAGVQRVDLEFKNGVLAPAPHAVFAFVFDADGRAALSGAWPPALEFGTPVWFQVLTVAPDGGVPVWAGSAALVNLSHDG